MRLTMRMTGEARAWLFLLALAGLFEIVWAFAMKRSPGLTRPYCAVIISPLAWWRASPPCGWRCVACHWEPRMRSRQGSARSVPFLVGVLLLREPINAMRLAAVSLILVGMVMLKLG